MCTGEVEISLPYDQGQQAIYSGAIFDSTQP